MILIGCFSKKKNRLQSALLQPVQEVTERCGYAVPCQPLGAVMITFDHSTCVDVVESSVTTVDNKTGIVTDHEDGGGLLRRQQCNSIIM